MQYTPAHVLFYVRLNVRFPEVIKNTFVDVYIVFLFPSLTF